MTDGFNSTLTWLDSSEQERRAVMELVSALNEPGTLDELGIGSVRDTIAEALFPGISTIQTRARYFLFIPWILQTVEARSNGSSEQLTRRLELQLCEALDKSHGAGAGVIGREARAALRRWPSSIYWVGLERWGIRRETGIHSFLSGLPATALGLVGGDMVASGSPRGQEVTSLRMTSRAVGRRCRRLRRTFQKKPLLNSPPGKRGSFEIASTSNIPIPTWLTSCEKVTQEVSGKLISRGSISPSAWRRLRWLPGSTMRGYSRWFTREPQSCTT